MNLVMYSTWISEEILYLYIVWCACNTVRVDVEHTSLSVSISLRWWRNRLWQKAGWGSEQWGRLTDSKGKRMSYTEPMSRPRVQCNSFSWYLYMYKQKNKLKKNEKKIRRPIAVLYVFSIALILQNLIESAGTVQKHAGLAHIWEKERQAMERELSKAHHDITKQDSLIKGLQHARDRSAIIINPHH